MDGSSFTTPWRAIFLGPFGGDVKTYTFRVSVSPPIKSGRTKVFPPHATFGATDPDVDDTLTTLNFMDISAGLGVYTISPASDLNSYWFGIAECEGTDGWTMAREAVMALAPDGVTGAHIPLGRIGASTYGLWDETICLWDPATQTWSDTGFVLPDPIVNVEGIAYFNEQMFIPLGDTGYVVLTESAPGTLAGFMNIIGAAAPAYVAFATPTTNPKPFAFVVWRETLYALTTKTDGHHLVSSMTGATDSWYWAGVADNSRNRYAKVETGFEPKQLVVFPNAQNQMSLWVVGRRGLKVFNDDNMTFEDSALVDPPPHPDFGRAVKVFRPGEALWIAGGGGDAIQYTVGGAVVPASGPGGAKEGLPGATRGSIVSWATDLFHLYALTQGEPLPGGATANNTVIAYTGKGWHPKWESGSTTRIPTRIVVSDAAIATAPYTDYRVFWGQGDQSWSMQCRLSTHSSRQAIQTGTEERFRSTYSLAGYTESYIEWGRWNGGSIAIHKLASHVALLMESATGTEYAEYFWYNDHHGNDDWVPLGVANTDQGDGEPRTVLPFGGVDVNGSATTDLDLMRFSKGEPFHWIRQRLRLVSANPTSPPIVTAMTLAYLPIRQDSATKSYTVWLAQEEDEVTGKTAEQTVQLIEALFSPDLGDEQFYFLQDGPKMYRAVISSISYSRAPTPGAPGSLNLTVIQVPVGVPGLLGES